QGDDGRDLLERHARRRLVEEEQLPLQDADDAQLELALLAVGLLAGRGGPLLLVAPGLEDPVGSVLVDGVAAGGPPRRQPGPAPGGTSSETRPTAPSPPNRCVSPRVERTGAPAVAIPVAGARGC